MAASSTAPDEVAAPPETAVARFSATASAVLLLPRSPSSLSATTWTFMTSASSTGTTWRCRYNHTKAKDSAATQAGCVRDLNRSRNRKQVIACKSACSAFISPRYCCTGSFGNPQSCKPTPYSKIFKAACPKAYSYAYDDPTSIATCSHANYLVTFCPHNDH